MANIQVLDDYYLAITALITIGYQLFFFSIAWTFKFDKLTGRSPSCLSHDESAGDEDTPSTDFVIDFAGGTNFVVLAIITLALNGTPNARQIIASVFIMVWGARLSGFLFFRILKTGKDDRFDDKRNRFFPFLGFWIFQMLWVWSVSLPVTVLNSPAVSSYRQHSFGTGRDIAGVILYAIGLAMETVSDAQKYRFRSSHPREDICDTGLFKFSRHPNYFGEIIVQFCE